jgi:hypothetical protein
LFRKFLRLRGSSPCCQSVAQSPEPSRVVSNVPSGLVLRQRIGARFRVGLSGGNNLEDDQRQRVGHCHNGSLMSEPRFEPLILTVKLGILLSRGGPCTLHQHRSYPRIARSAGARFLRPALSLFPGAAPAQELHLAPLPKTFRVSGPNSASRPDAASCFTPGMVCRI